MNHERGFYGLLGFVIGVCLMGLGSSATSARCDVVSSDKMANPRYFYMQPNGKGTLPIVPCVSPSGSTAWTCDQ